MHKCVYIYIYIYIYITRMRVPLVPGQQPLAELLILAKITTTMYFP